MQWDGNGSGKWECVDLYWKQLTNQKKLDIETTALIKWFDSRSLITQPGIKL
jgi:hypothetical protein